MLTHKHRVDVLLASLLLIAFISYVFGVWFWVAVRYGVFDLIVLDGFAVFIVLLSIRCTFPHTLHGYCL